MNHESEHAVGFIDAESQPLLANDSFAVSQLQEQNVESNAATRSPRTSFITAALMAAVIIMGGMAIYSSPLGFADSLVDEFTHMAAAGPSLFSASALTTKHTGKNANDRNIIYLDRHTMDCEPSIMKGFKMLGGPKYEYQCYSSQLGARTGAWGYNTGWQTAGENIYLDRHHAWCPDRTLMSRIQGKAKHEWGWKFTYDFACSRYDFKDFTCSDHYTPYNDAGDGIIYLDRHSVYCPDNKGLQGFEVQTSWGRIRYHYKCCSAYGAAPTAAPTASPTATPVANPTASPSSAPVANPTQQPTTEPSFSPTMQPTAKPSREPTVEPTEAPVISPTFLPSIAPISTPTLEPTLEPSLAPVSTPTQEPTVGDKVPKKPAAMTDDEWNEAIEYEKKKADVAEALPEAPVVRQAVNITKIEGDGSDEDVAKDKAEEADEDAIPVAPAVKAIEDEIADNKAEDMEEAADKVEKAALVANNASIPEVQKKSPSPDALIASGSDAIRYCAYTHTKEPGFVPVPVGCTLLGDENIDALPDGETANAALVCGLAEEGTDEMKIKMNEARLNSFAILMSGGISYVKPGAKTSATFYNNGDFTGASYTYTSGFHPPITNSANFNDNIKSLTVISTASDADFKTIEFPAVCSE